MPPDNVALPKSVVPSLKVTVPVGLVPVTNAVKVIVCAVVAGLGLTDSEVAVLPVAITRALTIDERVYGPDHPETKVDRENIESLRQEMRSAK